MTIAPVSADERIERLIRASARRVIDPDVDLPGEVGSGQVLPDELLSTYGLEVELTSEQRVRLSREEVASLLDMGIRFESVLMAGFALEMAVSAPILNAHNVYALYEIGEETRHSRMFLRVIEQLAPTASDPMRPAGNDAAHPLGPMGRFGRAIENRLNFALIRRPALFATLVLAGEEIPDLFQKLASEDPRTDPFLATVNRYHRQEEARHLSFARLQLADRWARATWSDRFAVRRLGPFIVGFLFDSFVHPGVYASVGLPGWRTWLAVRRLPQRRALRRDAARKVLDSLISAGIFDVVPRSWRSLCSVDRTGRPLETMAKSVTAGSDDIESELRIKTR
jgi:hypothetical protein